MGFLSTDKHQPATKIRAASNDNCASDDRLDQYYTLPHVAAKCYRSFLNLFDPDLYLMVEPSAGTGEFLKLLPANSLAYDVDPKYPGIATDDFLEVDMKSDRKIVVIGNPPFGKNASMAMRFVNRAALYAEVIALILPKTFKKASFQNRIDLAFHKIWEEEIEDNAFLFRSKAYNVPTVFQIWVRRDENRAQQSVEVEHPDFDFMSTSIGAEFAIQRVGARAGRVHHDFGRSAQAHYFIRGSRRDVEAIMRQLDFASVVSDTAGNPSLAKSEIVSMYRKYIKGRTGG